MKKHTKVYYDFFYEGDFTQKPLCEICFISGVQKLADDIHHIGGRGSGGSQLLDVPHKLIAVCRQHHDLCENQTISDESQIEDHLEFAEIMGLQLDENIARASLHQLTQWYKDGEYDPNTV